MRIGLDFHLAEREGTGNCTYSRNLFEAIRETGPEHTYFLYVTDSSRPYFRRFKTMPGVHLRTLPPETPLSGSWLSVCGRSPTAWTSSTFSMPLFHSTGAGLFCCAG